MLLPLLVLVVLVIGMLIKLESNGPVVFRQLRTGKGNKDVYLYKFRTMVVNKDFDKVQVKKRDARLTRIGGFLRKTGLEDFPQFFNVLAGEISIVA